MSSQVWPLIDYYLIKSDKTPHEAKPFFQIKPSDAVNGHTHL